MNNKALIKETINYVKKQLAGAEGGHDWWHIERVCKPDFKGISLH